MTIHPLTQALIEKGIVYAMECCPDRLTRPSKYTIEDAPGTIRRGSAKECSNCVRRRKNKEARENAACRNELEIYLASRRARGIPPEGIRYQAKEPTCAKQPDNSPKPAMNSASNAVMV